jgi:transposase InsO family protein
MKFRLIHQERRWHNLGALCSALGVTRGGYYTWLRHRPSSRDLGSTLLLSRIRRVHNDSNQTYGSPRVFEQLQNDGIRCGKKRVERLMRDNAIKAKQRKGYRPSTTDSAHDLPVAPNILNRQFNRQRPNEAWVADITYIATDEGWLYLAAVMDLFSRRIVGWSVGDRMTRHLPLRALHMAVQRRRPGQGIIHHSDRGSQYASADYQAELRRHGMVCSMSRVGNCWDNAVMESWFHTLKVERIRDERFATRQQALAAISEYIEVFYNRQRIHSSLRMSPLAFEEQQRLQKAS